MNELPFSPACERNKQVIAEQLQTIFPDQGRVLEIGSGTGQHVVHFSPMMPNLRWQPSDRVESLPTLGQRLEQEAGSNVLAAIQLDVLSDPWPEHKYDGVYSANTAHIMGWDAVCATFAGVGRVLNQDGAFCLYGPFMVDGEHTADSNAQFDTKLRSESPEMGIRDMSALESLAESHQMSLEQCIAMPANNFILVFRK